jgi:transcriptional/translational regulatory protein YebC/TACO1
MAGHSKWKNIQFRKEKQDAKKAKLFCIFSRDITNAALNGNERELELTVKMAKTNGVPKEIIERAIEKAKNKNNKLGEEVIYEGFGNQIAYIVKCFTDNRNRTAPLIREVFNKNNIAMKSVMYLFNYVGFAEIEEPISQLSNETLDLIEDFVEEDKRTLLFFSANNLSKMKELLKDKSVFEIKRIYKPIEPVTLEENNNVAEILEKFDEIDDVDEVFVNLE